MNIDTNILFLISEVNPSFSEGTKRDGSVWLCGDFEENSPCYVVLDFVAVDSSKTVYDEGMLDLTLNVSSQTFTRVSWRKPGSDA